MEYERRKNIHNNIAIEVTETTLPLCFSYTTLYPYGFYTLTMNFHSRSMFNFNLFNCKIIWCSVLASTRLTHSTIKSETNKRRKKMKILHVTNLLVTY